jgi:Family of unknown function (DUF6279)
MLALALLPACSAIKIAYNQAPDLTYWWLDGYIDFNGQQTEIASLFAWHRANELPKAAALLQKAQTLVPGSVTAAQACELYGQARGLIDTVTDKALPTIAELAPSFTPEQLQHLERKYQKNNDESLRESQKGTPDERAAKRLKQAIERSEMLYGKLDEPQVAAIQNAIQKSSFDPAVGRKERQRRQRDALAVMGKIAAEKPSPQVAQGMLREYINRVVTSPDPQYRAYAELMVKESCASFAQVHASTTAEQRSRAVITLKSYEVDLRTLVAQR